MRCPIVPPNSLVGTVKTVASLVTALSEHCWSDDAAINFAFAIRPPNCRGPGRAARKGPHPFDVFKVFRSVTHTFRFAVAAMAGQRDYTSPRRGPRRGIFSMPTMAILCIPTCHSSKTMMAIFTCCTNTKRKKSIVHSTAGEKKTFCRWKRTHG